MFGSINRSSRGRGLNTFQCPFTVAVLHQFLFGGYGEVDLFVAQEEDLVDIDFRLLEGYSGILQDSAQSVEPLLRVGKFG